QTLGEKTHAAVDLAQHFLAVDVLGVFGAVTEGCGLAHRLGNLRPAHMPQLMQLGAQARLALGGNQWGAGSARRTITAHGLPARRGLGRMPQPSRKTVSGL